MDIDEKIELIEKLKELPDAKVLNNQQPLTPPGIGTIVFVVQGQGKTPVIEITVGGDLKNAPLPGSPVFNSGELYLIPVIALPDWKISLANVVILGTIFTSKITSVGGGLSISQGGASPVTIKSFPYSTSGGLKGARKMPEQEGVAQQLTTDSLIVYQLTIAVPSSNQAILYIGNSEVQWIPLMAPSTGLSSITLTMVNPSSVYFKAGNTYDQIIYWYGGT